MNNYTKLTKKRLIQNVEDLNFDDNAQLDLTDSQIKGILKYSKDHQIGSAVRCIKGYFKENGLKLHGQRLNS